VRGKCGPGNDQCSQHGYDEDAPSFHVRDRSCGENDPNGTKNIRFKQGTTISDLCVRVPPKT
jgi:hypothetical protein